MRYSLSFSLYNPIFCLLDTKELEITYLMYKAWHSSLIVLIVLMGDIVS